jgi:hypothetical protein
MDKLETLVMGNALIDKLVKERDQLKKDLIKSCQEYKNFFECTWDYDPDLWSADRERDQYRWTISKLQELLQSPYPNYLSKIDDQENQLPY